jgi:hypothetical protein
MQTDHDDLAHRKVFKGLAFAVLVFIALSTLSPVTLRLGGGHPTWERFAALALFGICLGLGFPKSIWGGAIFAAVAVVGLEAFQELIPSRHGRIDDAIIKFAGALAGLGFAATVDFARKRIPRGDIRSE